MGRIVTIEPPKKHNETYYVLNDLHSHELDKSAFAIFGKYVLDSGLPYDQRYIILNGDILDCKFLYQKDDDFKYNIKHKEFDSYFVPKMQEEISWFDQLYSELIKLVPGNHIIYVEGNHEQRVDRDKFKDNIPCEYAHHFNWRKCLKLDERGITFIPYNDWLKIHDLYITHGMYCGSSPIKKHQAIVKGSVLFGHTHEIGITSFKSVTKTYVGYNAPCMCSLNANYMENKAHNWSVGFTEINVTPRNLFVNLHNIWNDQLMINGKLYEL